MGSKELLNVIGELVRSLTKLIWLCTGGTDGSAASEDEQLLDSKQVCSTEGGH